MSGASQPRPLVSVVLPCHNSGELLHAALHSVRAQTYPNLELVAVDDGSTDGSDRVLRAFGEACPFPVRILQHPHPGQHGIAASYRLLLSQCRGEYVAFLEHDDFWAENNVARKVAVLQRHPEVGVVCADVHICDEAGTVADRPFRGLVNRPPRDRPFRALSRLLWGDFVLTLSSVVLRRGVVGPGDVLDRPHGFQDWMLLLIVSSRCKFLHCSGTRTFWRQRGDSVHGRLRRVPDHAARYRKWRKQVLTHALERVLAERAARQSRARPGWTVRTYWRCVIALVSLAKDVVEAIERITGWGGLPQRVVPGHSGKSG